MSDTFHLVLIGSRFPQLALATLLAKRGRKVALIDLRADNSSSKKDTLGYSFRMRPAPLFGLDSDGLLRRFLDEVGIGHMLVKKGYPENPVSYQVVLPRHRINVYPRRESLFEEIGREFPESIDSFRGFYEEIDPLAESWYESYNELSSLENAWKSITSFSHHVRGILQARKIDSLIQTFEGPLEEEGFLALQHHFLGAFDLSAPPGGLSAALVHSTGLRGTFQEPTGTASLTTLMGTRFQEFGGEIRSGSRVVEVRTDSKNIVTIRMESGEELKTRSIAVTAAVAGKVDGLLQPHREIAGQGDSYLAPIRFYLGIDERIVPVGMEDNLFMLREDSGGPLGLKALYLALSPSGSEMSPEGTRSMTVTALIRSSSLNNLSRDLARETEEDLVEALESVIPFLGDGLNLIRSDLTGSIREGAPRPLGGGIIAWNPALIGRTRIRRGLRGKVAIMLPPPWELGLEGEALSALAAAGSLKRILGQEKK